jgi:hypothetical protein
MSVIIPPDILPESGETIELVDDQTFVFSGQFSRRYTQRNSYGDPRWRMRRTYRALRASDRARLLTALNEAQGAYRIVYVSPAQSIRGSFSAPEMLTNADFSQGTSGYTGTTGTNLSVVNQSLRMSRSVPSSPSPMTYTSVSTLLQHVPYALRCFIRRGRVTSDTVLSGPLAVANIAQTIDTGSTFFTAGDGLKTAHIVTVDPGAITQYPAWYDSTAIAPGEYVDVQYNSMARCFLVDNGPNLFTYSDAIDNADWIKYESTISTGLSGPDGGTTADRIVPTGVSGAHYAYQSRTVSSAVDDYCIAGAFRADGYNFVRLQIEITTGEAYQVFNLSNGTIGATAFTGTGWSHRRSFIRSMGEGWYYCALVVSKTNAFTVLTASIFVQNADSVAAFSGDGTSGVRVFRPAFAKSAMPVRLTTTTASTSPSGTAQTGSAIHVKGLPVSTNGLLVPGDWIEINQQLKMVTASLDSDAAGIGYLQFRPRLHRPVADNDPIIVTKPMGKFLLRDGAQWNNRYGLYMDIDLTLDEVYE